MLRHPVRQSVIVAIGHILGEREKLEQLLRLCLCCGVRTLASSAQVALHL